MPVKVNILITAYNQEKYIAQCVASALDQDYPDLTVIVSDNCSTDGTAQALRPFLSNKRLVYSRNLENIGMLKNFNKLLYDLADAQYALFLPGDDYLIDKSFISQAIRLVQAAPGLPMVFGAYKILYEKSGFFYVVKSGMKGNDIIEGKDVFLNYGKKYHPTLNALVFNVHEVRKMRHFEPENEYYGMDISFCLNLALLGKVGYIGSEVVVWRRHPQSDSRLLTPVEFLKGFLTFEIPYRIAKEKHAIDGMTLNRWRIRNQFRIARSQMFRYALTTPSSGITFEQGIRRAYPAVHALLKKDIKLNSMKILIRFRLYFMIRLIMKYIIKNEYLYEHYRTMPLSSHHA